MLQFTVNDPTTVYHGSSSPSEVTGSSNTRSQFPSTPEIRPTISLDTYWLRFPAGSALAHVQAAFADWLPPALSWDSRPCRMNGREVRSTWGLVVVFHGGPYAPLVVLSGQAVSYLRSLPSWPGDQAFAGHMLTFDVECTRLDPCIDDTSGNVTVQACYQRAIAGSLRRRCKSRPRAILKDIAGDGTVPECGTLYIGDRASNSMLRIYDKAQERFDKEGITPEGPWTRVEMVLRGERAHAAFLKLASSGLAWVPGVIRAFVEFKEAPVQGIHTERVGIWDAWAWLLDNAEVLRLHIPPIDITVERMRRCAVRMRRSFALMRVIGGDALVAHILTEGHNDLTNVHWLAVLDWQDRQRTAA